MSEIKKIGLLWLVVGLAIVGIIPLAILGLQTASVYVAFMIGIADILFGAIVFIVGILIGLQTGK